MPHGLQCTRQRLLPQAPGHHGQQFQMRKIENEYNNVLKHRGYNLEHNFGHGESHASELFCLLNVYSYLIHGIQDIADEDYQRARARFGRRDAFFWALRYEMSRYFHEDWHSFFMTIAGEPPGG
jgi:hypothetical protein